MTMPFSATAPARFSRRTLTCRRLARRTAASPGHRDPGRGGVAHSGAGSGVRAQGPDARDRPGRTPRTDRAHRRDRGGASLPDSGQGEEELFHGLGVHGVRAARFSQALFAVSYTHLRAHETDSYLV